MLATCFGQGRERLYEFERFLCKSLIHFSKQTLWLSGREFKGLFDVAEKRILVNQDSPATQSFRLLFKLPDSSVE